MTITCQGIYQTFINGEAVTDRIFTPDYTDYSDFLMYQTYEIADLLRTGENVLAVEGYADRISVQGGSAQFGDQLALLADVDITFENGEELHFGTDESFSLGEGKHRYADIQISEKHNLRLNNDWKTSATRVVQEALFSFGAISYPRIGFCPSGVMPSAI